MNKILNLMPYKILQITNKPPFPEVDGGSLGIAKMSKFYANHSKFKLSIFATETHKHPLDKKAIQNSLPKETPFDCVFIDTKPTWLGAIKAIFNNKSYNMTRFNQKAVSRKLTGLLSENEYDFVQFENIFVAQYYPLIKKLSKAKIVLNSANVEYEIWERLSCKSSFLKRTYFSKLAKQLKKEEEQIWNSMDAIICATDKDKQTIEIETNSKNLITVPFYLDNKKYIPKHKESINEVSFFHLGAMDWLPNVEGIEWFIDSVWNKIPQPKQLFIAGKSMPKPLLNIPDFTIVCEGFVPDAKEYMLEHDVMIVPLHSGSGIRVKIIEAMALGKCIISTSVGLEGIEYTEGKNVLIANTADEFVYQITKLTSNPTMIKQIGEEAKKLALSHYDITNMEKVLVPFLSSL